MCLLFFYLNPDANENEYRLILINNRDEFYSRPTMPAAFWGQQGKSIIAGRDQAEGGTWLAIHPNGRFSCILNILQPNSQIDKSRKSRGRLTTNYVNSQLDPMEYLEDINGGDYNGFLLVAMDLKNSAGGFYTNASDELPKEISPGINVFGNSPPIRLWPKATAGRELFENIVKGKTETKKRNRLVSELEALLKDGRYYPVDEQMLNQGDGMKLEFIKKLSSVYVEIKEFNYGTRSHTIVLVDGAGNVEYIEHSMIEPINIYEHPKWMKVCEKFKIE